MKKGCTTTVCKEASNEISTICNHNVWEWAMNALGTQGFMHKSCKIICQGY